MSIFSATVCLVCGGSGRIQEHTIIGHIDDFDEVVEEEECDHCAGTGWEPPE